MDTNAIRVPQRCGVPLTKSTINATSVTIHSTHIKRGYGKPALRGLATIRNVVIAPTTAQLTFKNLVLAVNRKTAPPRINQRYGSTMKTKSPYDHFWLQGRNQRMP